MGDSQVLGEQLVGAENTIRSSLTRCVAIDLEIEPVSNHIRALAAVRSWTGEGFVRTGGSNREVLAALDAWSADAAYVVGHNILDFDLPHLAERDPSLNLLRLPAVDTLRLNPLAFPRNPYHHLVKHYRDGRLIGSAPNDPEADARLSLTLLDDQVAALTEADRRSPDLVAGLHWLVAQGPNSVGFDAVFRTIRKAPPPSPDEARDCIQRILRDEACGNRLPEVSIGTE